MAYAPPGYFGNHFRMVWGRGLVDKTIQIISEAVQGAEVVGNYLYLNRFADEVVSLSESLLTFRAIIYLTNEVQRLVETISRAANFIRPVDEAVNAIESIVEHAAFIRTTNEAVQIVELVNLTGSAFARTLLLGGYRAGALLRSAFRINKR